MEQGTPRAQPRGTPRLPASPAAAGRAPQSWPALTLRRPPQPCPRAADLCLLLGLPPTPVPKRRSINAPRTERAPLPGGHWLTYPCNHVGVSPWPRGLHLHLLFPSSRLGSLPRPSAGSLGSGLPAFPSRRHTASRRPRLARACPRSSSSLAGLSGPARSCHNPGPGEAGAGEPGAEPLCWNSTQTEAWKAGFLENFLEPGLVGSHTQGFQAPQSQVQTPHRDSETCPASALNLPVRALNSSLTSGPVHMLFPTLSLVWAAGDHLLQEAFPQAPAQVDGGPFTLGGHCPCPALHPNHPEPSPGPA